MAFRVLDPAPVFWNTDGVTPCAGGTLTFSDTGTTTPKNVYADPALTVNNGSTVDLDSAGRANVDIWGDGEYRVVLMDGNGVIVWTRDNVRDVASGGLAIPALVTDAFLTNDGANSLWAAIRQVPDPAGASDKVLSNDGENLIWIAKPANGADATNVTDNATGFTVGSFAVRTGTDTAPNVGGRSTSKAVTFATAFASPPVFIGITPTYSTVSTNSNQPSWTITTSSASGFTVKFTMGELDDSRSQFDFNAAVPFQYVAMGVKV